MRGVDQTCPRPPPDLERKFRKAERMEVHAVERRVAPGKSAARRASHHRIPGMRGDVINACQHTDEGTFRSEGVRLASDSVSDARPCVWWIVGAQQEHPYATSSRTIANASPNPSC